MSVLLAASMVASAAFASTAHSLDVKLVNESGKSPDDIYVTLTCGNKTPCDSTESRKRSVPRGQASAGTGWPRMLASATSVR